MPNHIFFAQYINFKTIFPHLKYSLTKPRPTSIRISNSVDFLKPISLRRVVYRMNEWKKSNFPLFTFPNKEI